MIRRLVACLAGAAALAGATPVLAHSLLLEASPAPNATVTAPGRVALRFNNRIEHRLSRVRLVGPAGARQDLALVDDGTPDRLVAPAPPSLAAGPWHVEWQVLSADGHVVSGRYPFRVAP